MTSSVLKLTTFRVLKARAETPVNVSGTSLDVSGPAWQLHTQNKVISTKLDHDSLKTLLKYPSLKLLLSASYTGTMKFFRSQLSGICHQFDPIEFC
jgi:hypothetical protein